MMKVTSFLFILLFYYPKISTSSSYKTITNENFIHCFKNNTTPNDDDDDDDLSHIIYSTVNSSYTSILQAYIQNLRFNTPKTRKPEFIITPRKKSHVSTVVLCTKTSGLTLRIRSGGHDFEGLSYTSADTPFVILDMFHLRSIDVNVDKQIAYVESGATIGELYYKISEKTNVHGFPAGICPTVGVGGHISGGGYGNMIRKYGLSVDHIVDAELVDVNGRILDRNSMEEDLFWAIKGGGGANFGVVLSYTVSLVPVPEKVTVFRVFRVPEDNVISLVYKWQHIMQDIDENLFIRVVLQPIMPKFDDGPTTIRVTFMSLFLGGAPKVLSVMNSEFPELGVQKTDCFEMSWAQSVLYWYNYDNETDTKVLLNRTYNAAYIKRKSDYVTKPISEHGLELLWKKLTELKKPGIVLNSYGGKMKEVSESETPFPHRNGNLYKIQYSISWKEAGENEERKHINMIRELHEFMTPYVSNSPRSAYLNYRDLDIGVTRNFSFEEGKVFGEKYFKGNFDKLVKIKSKVDADNFFRNEQSIPVIKSVGKKLKIVYVMYFVSGFCLIVLGF